MILLQIWRKHLEKPEELILKTGEQFTVSPNIEHRFIALENTIAYEIYYVELQDDDIIRLIQGHLLLVGVGVLVSVGDGSGVLVGRDVKDGVTVANGVLVIVGVTGCVGGGDGVGVPVAPQVGGGVFDADIDGELVGVLEIGRAHV